MITARIKISTSTIWTGMSIFRMAILFVELLTSSLLVYRLSCKITIKDSRGGFRGTACKRLSSGSWAGHAVEMFICIQGGQPAGTWTIDKLFCISPIILRGFNDSISLLHSYLFTANQKRFNSEFTELHRPRRRAAGEREWHGYQFIRKHK